MSENTKTPYLIAIIIQLIFTIAYILNKAALNNGMNPFVFSFYRQATASLLLLSIAFVFQRKNTSSLSPRLLLKLFFCALIGNTLCINLVNVSMTLTSVTVASATANSVPVFTFCFALLFRMEALKLRSSSGVAKLFGIGFCIAGVFIIAFYAGPTLSPVNHHHAFTHTSPPTNPPSGVTWIKGTFLMVFSCVAWSIWLIMQTGVLKEYPHKMLVTITQCVFSTVQCFLVTVVAERDFNKWKLRLDINFLAVICNGFLVTGLCYYLQVWCIKMKGPVFLAMWTPLLFIFTIFCSSFFLGEVVHLGSIIGGILLVCGLYTVLWGKAKEPTVNPRDDIQGEKDQHSIPELKEEKASMASV